MAAEPPILWSPTAELIEAAPVTAFRREAEARTGLDLEHYRDLWRWSTRDLSGFWGLVWDHFGLSSPTPVGAVVSGRMPEARWFEGASLNYAEQVFRQESGERPALIACGEDGEPEEISWARLRAEVAGLSQTLRELGVEPGDRVAGYLPNRPEAVVGLLASAAVGAIWSVCSPDFGVENAIARLDQLRPKVLIAADSYRFGGKLRHRGEEVEALLTALDREPTLIAVGEPSVPHAGGLGWDVAVGREAELTFASLPFDHPLWVLFSSGTTGAPKGIVHGHGGIVVEHLKGISLGSGLAAGNRFYFYSSTGWMVWNYLIGALLVGAVPVLYDGSPGYPDILGSWRVAAATGADCVGLGAAYVGACRAAGETLSGLDLGALRTVISTGSPLSQAGWEWLHDELPSVRIDPSSGGTDVCSSLILGSPILPVALGRIPAPALGVAAAAWDDDGNPVRGTAGELVITAPMPSMPIYFWNDPEGSRYRGSYFDRYPGVWRHGDSVVEFDDGSFVIEGRSDATLNRGGVRMGSAEIYAAVETVPAVDDSLVIGVELEEGEYYMPLFVSLAEGHDLDAALREEILDSIRRKLSPRHAPDEIVRAAGIPRTLTGKRLEVPVKRMFQGTLDALDPSTVDKPESLAWFVAAAREYRERG